MATDKQPPRSASESSKSSNQDAARTIKAVPEVASRTTASSDDHSAKRAGAAAGDATAASQEAVRAAAETMRHASAAASQRAERLSDDASQRFSQFFNISARASEDMSQRTQQTLDLMLQCGSVLGDGFQAIVREWADYTQGAVQRNVDGLNAMMRARSVQDLLSVQAERMREEMELFLDTGARVSELSAQASHDALQRLQTQGERRHRGGRGA